MQEEADADEQGTKTEDGQAPRSDPNICKSDSK
jgi:hypothetical protein